MRTAVYCATRNLYGDMETAAKSLLKNTPSVERVWFLIEDDEFPRPLPDCIRVKNVSGQTWFKPGGPNYSTGWTWMVLMRAVLPEIFPELDMVLSLDCDTIVEADVGALWKLPMEDMYFAAVKEPMKSAPGRPYVNYGVSFHNLKKQREDRIPKKAARLLNGKAYEAPEQDVMNELCRGHILLLPGGWNISNWTDGNFLERKIRHYAAEGKSRYRQPLWLMYERMPWEKVRPQVSRK